MRNIIFIIQLVFILTGCNKENLDELNDAGINLTLSYPIVDTNQKTFYNNISEISKPTTGDLFYGQDAQYSGNQPSYNDNGDGTITDNVTGLMWTKNIDGKVTFEEAKSDAQKITTGGYTDWRLPTIKELYSLILFSGTDPSGPESISSIPFLNDNYFEFEFGDESASERIIDAQYWSSTEYVSTTIYGAKTTFGVNFADGRIKGYPNEQNAGGRTMTQFVRYVRGNTDYGKNSFRDNGDGTVTDLATGLMWQQDDNGSGINWQEALSYAENLETAGHNDWRLPNAKELESIVDYTRSPATTNSPAIDPVFKCSEIADEGGDKNYPFYWTGTTHVSANGRAANAAYISFGEALGYMESYPGASSYTLMDVHGAGAQRSDPKTGNPDDYPYGHGPQGDVIRIYNYVRCVRNIE